MDVRIVSTGRVFKQIDSTLAVLLMEMFPAAIERNKPTPANEITNVPGWSVFRHAVAEQWVVQMTLGQWTEVFNGTVEQVRTHFQKINHPAPEEIIERYAAALKQDTGARQIR